MIESIFQEFGLTKYEAKVYLALIELGESTTGQILSKANIHSGKIYLILDFLKNKGFVNEIIKNGIKRYTPTEPNEIIAFFEKKRKNIGEQEKMFKDLLPELTRKIKDSRGDFHLEIFTGYEGMKKAFEKEIKLYGKSRCLRINGITNYVRFPEKFVNYFKFHLFQERERSKVEIKKIIDQNASSNPHETQAEIRFLKYSSIITFNAIANLVIISVWTPEPIFLTIESTEISKAFNENFDLLWKFAKP